MVSEKCQNCPHWYSVDGHKVCKNCPLREKGE